MPDTMMTETPPAYRNRSPEIKDLAAALVKAQAALTGAKKESKAIITGSQARTYADLASVWEAIREPLTANDLCIVQFPRTAGQGVEIETTLMHGKSGQFMSDVLWVPCGKNDAQGLGSAITYGRRYALMAVVGVCPVDDDGAAASAGAHGSAGAGGDFRPAGRRTLPAAGAQGASIAQARDDIASGQNGTTSATKGVAAKPNAADAHGKRMEWVKKSADALKSMNAAGAKMWWKDEADRIGVIETALPTEYERLLDAYNSALERPVELA